MYDMQGRLVKRVFEGKVGVVEDLVVDVSQLGVAVYFYKITTASAQMAIKFVKE